LARHHLQNWWIGRGAPFGNLAWPPRSPDLIPPDFFLWGHVKQLTYSKDPSTPFDAVVEFFKEIPIEMCRKVCRSVPVRLRTCMDIGGSKVVKNAY
jgi:hypothetical protein